MKPEVSKVKEIEKSLFLHDMAWKNRLINIFLVTFLLICSGVILVQFIEGHYHPVITVAAFTFLIAFLVCLIYFNRKGLQKEEKYQLKSDSAGVACFHPEKSQEYIRWDEIYEIIIITTDKGPDEPYIWILLATEKGTGCVFPLGAKNGRHVVEKILGFPGLNLIMWAEALKSNQNNRFVVWRKN